MARMVTSIPALIALLMLLATAATAASINIGRLTHYLGNGTTAGANNGTGTGVNGLALNRPTGCVVDTAETLFIADSVNHIVRSVSARSSSTPSLYLGTFNVSGNALGNSTVPGFLGTPIAVRLSPDFNTVYVLDFAKNLIFSVNKASRQMAYFAGNTAGNAGSGNGVGTAASFESPADLTISADGVNMFVSEEVGHRVRKITVASATVANFAGSTSSVSGSTDGTAGGALFNQPHGLAINGNTDVYVADSNNNRIRKITQAQVVTTVAGNVSGSADGVGTLASFTQPWGLAIDNVRMYLYIADKGNNAVRRMDLVSNMVDTVVNAARLSQWSSSPSSVTGRVSAPNDVCFSPSSSNTRRLYITGDHSVAYVNLVRTRTVSVTLPAGPTTTAAANATTTAAANATTTAPGGSTLAPNATTTVSGTGFTTFAGGSTLPPNGTLSPSSTSAPGGLSAAHGPAALLPLAFAAVVVVLAGFAA